MFAKKKRNVKTHLASMIGSVINKNTQEHLTQ